MATFGPLKKEIVVIDRSPVSATISGRIIFAPCPLILPLESFCHKNVTVHETSLSMSWYVFPLHWGVLVKEVSQGIKILMAEKTSSFIRTSYEFRVQDIRSKI